MDGIVFDLFNHLMFRYDLLIFYFVFSIVDMLSYLILTKIFNVDNFDDRVIMCHLSPLLLMLILGFFYPMFWYLGCVHLVVHFFIETLFLFHHGIYEYTVHHIYTILFLGPVAMFTAPYICACCLIPMLNNIVHHGARVFDLTDQTRTFRQIFFLFSRIIYPIVMILFVPFVVMPIMMKISLFFFAITIVMLMAPKLGSIHTQSDMLHNIPPGFGEMGHRLGIGYLDIARWFCSRDR